MYALCISKYSDMSQIEPMEQLQTDSEIYMQKLFVEIDPVAVCSRK